jgi:glutathione synthase/RimK-type ligase-like ATP-grasp enzyme
MTISLLASIILSMKICIIGPKESREVKLLRAAAETRELECKRIDLIDVYFETKGTDFAAYHRKIELLDYDVFIFRVNSKYSWNILMLAEYLHQKGKKIVDGCLASERCFNEASLFKLAQNGVAQAETYQTVGIKSARDILMEIEHPITIKFEKTSKDGNKETKVIFSDDWTESYDLVRTNKNKEFTFRTVVNTDHYFKVYVIGDEVVGGLCKRLTEDTFKLNYSKNVKSKSITVTDAMADISLRACKALSIQIASVDLVVVDGQISILDVHRAPKFVKFQKLSNVDFADRVIQYCIDTKE